VHLDYLALKVVEAIRRAVEARIRAAPMAERMDLQMTYSHLRLKAGRCNAVPPYILVVAVGDKLLQVSNTAGGRLAEGSRLGFVDGPPQRVMVVLGTWIAGNILGWRGTGMAQEMAQVQVQVRHTHNGYVVGMG
jgi:hypothetical protein